MSSAASKLYQVDCSLLTQLINSDIRMARVFVETARSSFAAGMIEQGEFARLKAIKFYCCALRTQLELGALERGQFASEIDGLRIQIEWLLTQFKVQDPKLLQQEEVFMNNLLQLLGDKG